MQPTEILHEIVAAERQARLLYAKTQQQYENLDAELEQQTEAIRKTLFEKADADIAATEAEETAWADSQIAALDKKLSDSLDALKKKFEANRDVYARRIFETVTGQA